MWSSIWDGQVGQRLKKSAFDRNHAILMLANCVEHAFGFASKRFPADYPGTMKMGVARLVEQVREITENMPVRWSGFGEDFTSLYPYEYQEAGQHDVSFVVRFLDALCFFETYCVERNPDEIGYCMGMLYQTVLSVSAVHYHLNTPDCEFSEAESEDCQKALAFQCSQVDRFAREA